MKQRIIYIVSGVLLVVIAIAITAWSQSNTSTKAGEQSIDEKLEEMGVPKDENGEYDFDQMVENDLAAIETSAESNVDQSDLNPSLEVSNINQRQSASGLFYILGEIENISNQSIEGYYQLNIFNQAGELIKVQNTHLKIPAGGIHYFEELVGQEEHGHSVKLTEM